MSKGSLQKAEEIFPPNGSKCIGLCIVLLLSLSMLVVQGMPAQALVAGAQAQRASNFDARIDYNRDYAPAPGLEQHRAIQELRDVASGVGATYNEATGVTRSLLRRGGPLTEERSTADALSVAEKFIANYYAHLGLTADDLGDYEVTDEVYSSVTKVTHIYMRQLYLGLPVYNGQLHININADGRILSVNNTCMPDIAAAASSENPVLSAADAVAAAATHLQIQLDRPPEVVSVDSAPGDITTLRGDGISRSRIDPPPDVASNPGGRGTLGVEFPDSNPRRQGCLRPHNRRRLGTGLDPVQLGSPTTATGCTPTPIESPSHADFPPPADDRQIVVDPADSLASPFGWHDDDGVVGADFTIHRGNNVHAYDDTNDTNGGICTEYSEPAHDRAGIAAWV